MRLSRTTTSAFLLLALSLTAWAAPVTYVYTGPNFDNFSGTPIPGPGDHMTWTVTFPGALIPKNIYSYIENDWTATDGHATLYSSSAEVWGGSRIYTGAGGQITGWHLLTWASNVDPFSRNQNLLRWP
jgi:hypothetical protein